MTEKMPGVIREITLDKATFHGERLQPTLINFFFGRNGVGKSTTARAFEDPAALHWQTGVNPDNYSIFVFNQDFIRRNFETYEGLQGVFTLSEENIAIRNQISEKTALRNEAAAAERAAAEELVRRQAELEPLLAGFQTACWDRTEDTRKAFEKTLKGKKKKAQFVQEVLSGKYTAIHHTAEEIRAIYDIAYDPNTVCLNLFRTSKDLPGEYDLSGSRLLGQPITNISDTAFARYMKAIKASDWVKYGHDNYTGHTDGKCPFCQQVLPESFIADITACFDEQFRKDMAELDAFHGAYVQKTFLLNNLLHANLDELSPYIDTRLYEAKEAQLETRVVANLQTIDDKIENPEKCVEITDIDKLISEIDALAAQINLAIAANNDIVKHRGDKQQECCRMVWEEIAFLLKDELAAYAKNRKRITDAVDALEKRIRELKKENRKLTAEIAALNGKMINTGVTVDSINAHLIASGYEGFRLREKEGAYGIFEVIREDGSIAENLSEGERNFIAFLYFYHIVRGGRAGEEAGKDRIVVIDDPVSSMDSGALFLVSAIVRELLEACACSAELKDCAYEGAPIRQMFVLTHNAFFHTEITHDMTERYRYVSFYLIEKKRNISTVRHCVERAIRVSERDRNYNPVKNAYAALWEEYASADQPVPLMNVMRRILEYYFLEICGYGTDGLYRAVLEENRDRFVSSSGDGMPDYTRLHLAQAMLSCIKRTSSLNDGLYFVDESADLGQYKDTFRLIFEAMGQSQHYEKMMREMRDDPGGSALWAYDGEDRRDREGPFSF